MMKRVRFFALIAVMAMISGLVSVGWGGARDATAHLQEASPEAEEPADGTPAAENPDDAIVTIVAFYQQDESGDFLSIGPVSINPVGVARPGEGTLSGRADFDDPDNDDLPRITIGDSVFDAYPLDPDDPDTVFRWLYLNDEQGSRPATLVMQIECTSSPAYKDYTGTATFVSRSSEAGGVLVIVLTPPSSDSDE